MFYIVPWFDTRNFFFVFFLLRPIVYPWDLEISKRQIFGQGLRNPMNSSISVTQGDNWGYLIFQVPILGVFGYLRVDFWNKSCSMCFFLNKECMLLWFGFDAINIWAIWYRLICNVWSKFTCPAAMPKPTLNPGESSSEETGVCEADGIPQEWTASKFVSWLQVKRV